MGIQQARRVVPPQLDIVSVWPGKTLGGILLGRYMSDSTLHYNELAVLSGLVLRGARLGMWVSHIYVDSEHSLQAGREVWGLPKELAEFDRSVGIGSPGRVTHGGECIFRLLQKNRFRTGLLPAVVPIFGIVEDSLRWSVAAGTFKGNLSQVELVIPPESPFAGLGLEHPFLALSGVINATISDAKSIRS